MSDTPKPTPTPYTYGRGTRLSAAYTKGRDGLPMPAEAREPTSAARKAWEAGRAEYLATTTPQHTPTPWIVLHDDHTGEQFLSAAGYAVPSEPFRDADLDFIVRAVNAYEPMREALKEAAAWIDADAEEGPLYPLRPERKEFLDRIAAALALAEKE